MGVISVIDLQVEGVSPLENLFSKRPKTVSVNRMLPNEQHD